MAEISISPNSDGAKTLYEKSGANLAARPAAPARPMLYKALDTGYYYLWDGSTWTFLGGYAPPTISPVQIPKAVDPSGVSPTIFESAAPLTINFHAVFTDQDTDQCPDVMADILIVGAAGTLNGIPTVTQGSLVSYRMVAPNTARVIVQANPAGAGAGLVEGTILWNTAEPVYCTVVAGPYCAASELVAVTP